MHVTIFFLKKKNIFFFFLSRTQSFLNAQEIFKDDNHSLPLKVKCCTETMTGHKESLPTLMTDLQEVRAVKCHETYLA